MSWYTPNYAIPGLMPVTSPKSETSLSLLPANIYLESHVHLDDWAGIPTIGPVLFNGVQPSAALVSARMIFYRELLSIPELILTTEEDLVVISDGDDWELSIPVVEAGAFPLDLGQWKWIIDTVDADGVKRSLYNGVLEVTEARP